MHRETRVANYLLAGLSSVCLILMSLPLSGPVQALKACLSYAFNPVAYYGEKGVSRLAHVPSNLRALVGAEIRNQALLEELKGLHLLRAEAEALRKENARLRSSMGLKPGEERSGLWAH